jgi:deoxyribose-phosphate aldolase
MGSDRRLLIGCLDRTALAEVGDADSISALCDRAEHPVPSDVELTVAAVCIRPRFASLARDRLRDTPVAVACATGGFPTPDAPLSERLEQIGAAIDAGADEVDVPLNRFLLDEPDALRGELDAMRAAAGSCTWKAIIETGALEPEEIARAARAAIDAGADFLKTSTGMGPPGATPAAAQTLAELIATAGRPVGLKISGGIRGAGQATGYLDLVRSVLGPAWPAPATFRIGASALLDALLA